MVGGGAKKHQKTTENTRAKRSFLVAFLMVDAKATQPSRMTAIYFARDLADIDRTLFHSKKGSNKATKNKIPILPSGSP